ncbi:MAG TPA: hypothetical protein VF808_12600 [Ktedonobacterales bacterium]
MVARIAGGVVAGWILSLTPLIVVNALSLTSSAVDPSSTAVVGIVALGVGIALGGLGAGLIGGRRGGAIAGAIAGALNAASLIALKYLLRAQGALPNLVAQHPVRSMGALVFIGALVAGVALGVSALLGLREREERPSATPLRQPTSVSTAPRQSGPGYPGDPRGAPPQWRNEGAWAPDSRRGPPASGPRQPPSSDRRPAAARYDARDRWPDATDRW